MDDAPFDTAPSVLVDGARRTLARLDRRAMEALDAAGVLDRLGRVELVEGVLVRKSPHGDALSALDAALFARLHPAFAIGADIGVSLADDTIRAPDIVVRPRGGRPGWLDPADVLLAVEVADGTLDTDLAAKARLYAGAGIGEYWVIDLAGRTLIVHRAPGPEGYADTRARARSEAVAPACAPDAAVLLADLLEGIV